MKTFKFLLPFALAANVVLAAETNVAPVPPEHRHQPEKPTPDLANVKYGPHERNALDLWKAKSDKPTPLVVNIHGGAFRAGDKAMFSPVVLEMLRTNGISMMSINYRLSPEFHFPAHYMDCARAIQFARRHAKEWNIDPKRIGAMGGSAGAGTALWIGFHKDLADPKNADPVLRESTRLSCMFVLGAQSTYDPRVIKEWINENTSKHPAFLGFYGLKTNELDTARAYKLYEDASPVNHLTADDPAVFLYYNQPDKPLPASASANEGIHHPVFGRKLKEKMDALKIECAIRNDGNFQDDMLKFFLKHFAPGKASAVK